MSVGSEAGKEEILDINESSEEPFKIIGEQLGIIAERERQKTKQLIGIEGTVKEQNTEIGNMRQDLEKLSENVKTELGCIDERIKAKGEADDLTQIRGILKEHSDKIEDITKRLDSLVETVETIEGTTKG
ncbi:MAG: hypothetical protein LBR09_02970 [Endomicrobium sp.]|nr:hypothetical protein [Endomicrobium sp.]